MIAMAWVIASLLFVIPLSGIWGKISNHESLKWMCDIRDGQSFKVFAIFVVFVSSLIILIGCYYSIFQKLKSIRRDVSVYFNAEKNSSSSSFSPIGSEMTSGFVVSLSEREQILPIIG